MICGFGNLEPRLCGGIEPTLTSWELANSVSDLL